MHVGRQRLQKRGVRRLDENKILMTVAGVCQTLKQADDVAACAGSEQRQTRGVYSNAQVILSGMADGGLCV